MNNFNNFHTVKDLKFDILKLRTALKQVLSRKSYDDAAGTKYIAGIALNQIPGNPESIKTVNDVWEFSKNMWSQDPTWYLVGTAKN